MAEIIVELLAFVVVIFVLYRWVKPMIQQMVRDRQDQIQQQVEASEEATRRLQEAQRRFEHAEAEARKEVAKIRDDARADATRIGEELREQANREIERIRQRGQEQLAAQRDLMVRSLRAELGGHSMRLAERIVTDALGRRPAQERDRGLVPGRPGSHGAAVRGGRCRVRRGHYPGRGPLMAILLSSASRESLAAAGQRLDDVVDRSSGAELTQLGEDLFAVLRLLAGQTTLRRHLADPSVPADARSGAGRPAAQRQDQLGRPGRGLRPGLRPLVASG